MAANKEFKDDIVKCKNCNKLFHPRYSIKGIYCSIKCQKKYQSSLKYNNYLLDQNSYYGQTNMRWIKPFILKEQNFKCSICGMGITWNNKSLIFVLDHKNGHSNDNSRNNLQLVCPNCDSQLDTYKNKNKVSDRLYYHYNHR